MGGEQTGKRERVGACTEVAGGGWVIPSIRTDTEGSTLFSVSDIIDP